MRKTLVIGVLGALAVACGSASPADGGDGTTETGLHRGGAPGHAGKPGHAAAGQANCGAGGSTATQCKSDGDCPVTALCKPCPDGSCANPNVHCENGECTPPDYTCPSADECKTAADCAVPQLCKLCPDGSSSCAKADCQAGKCITTFPACPAPGTLSWYETCGLPVCPGPSTGGASSGLPPCDPAGGQKQGAPCKVEGQTCDPGSACGEKLLCTTSDPTHGGNCPISRAKYKEDIQYLSSAERDQLATEVNSIPLVRYRYKDAPEREHLGFIIEDVEPSPSVDSKRDQVDLYGYTSMAVAALQKQQRQIDSLRKQVDELTRKLSTRSK